MRIHYKSLNMRLFAGVTMILTIFVVISWAANTFLLPKYYYANKERELARYFKEIYPLYRGNVDTISTSIEKLEQRENIWLFILGPKLNFKYDTMRARFKRNQPPPGGDTKGIRLPDPGKFRGGNNTRRRPSTREVIKGLTGNGSLGIDPGNYVFKTLKDESLPLEYVSVIGRASNGDYIVLRSHAAALDKSARMASQFFLLTGIVLIIVSSIFSYSFSRRFTGPINRISRIADRMSRLDFSEKYRVDSEDEIGGLGMSINTLSRHLEEAVSGLKEANLKLQDDIEEKTQLEEMRKEFIANVSHELKTPISLIQGYAEGLVSGVTEDAESRSFYCDVIMDEARKMDRLVRQLLDLSKIESGHVKPERSVFDIGELMDKVVRKSSYAMSDLSCGVEVAAPSGIMVSADKTMAEQVLMNYLTNAVKHVPEDGRISITAEVREPRIRIMVNNSGSSVPEDQMVNIWTSFYKLDKARTRETESTGLGLSIVKAIQDAHGNGCGAFNTGDGVTFWFDLDLVRA